LEKENASLRTLLKDQSAPNSIMRKSQPSQGEELPLDDPLTKALNRN